MHVMFGISFILLSPSLQQYLQASAIIAIMIKAWGNYIMIAPSIALAILLYAGIAFSAMFPAADLFSICYRYAVYPTDYTAQEFITVRVCNFHMVLYPPSG